MVVHELPKHLYSIKKFSLDQFSKPSNKRQFKYEVGDYGRTSLLSDKNHKPAISLATKGLVISDISFPPEKILYGLQLTHGCVQIIVHSSL